MTKVCTVSKEETQALAKLLLEELGKQVAKLGQATVVGLRGDLGAGKTTLAQGIAAELGVVEHVTSPTFILERIYKLSGENAKLGNWERLVHIDAYRLDDEKELKHLGWQELLGDPANLILIEWPERVEAGMPADTLYVDCKHVDELRREISW